MSPVSGASLHLPPQPQVISSALLKAEIQTDFTNDTIPQIILHMS